MQHRQCSSPRALVLTILVALFAAACSTSQRLPVATTEATAQVTEATIPTPDTTRPTLTPPAPTTTLPPAPRCRPDPFPEQAATDLARRFPGREMTAHVYDTRTGCSYSLNPDNRQKTASVFKILVMSGTLLEAQTAGRQVTQRELDLMTPMITRSTNSQVRTLWRSFGGGDWFQRTADAFQLSDLDIVGDFNTRPWGRTRTSAKEQVDLIRQVLLGEWGPLDEDSRQVAMGLMTSVVPDQTWGITAGVPDDWTVAQKNGFDGGIVNSVGWVDEPGNSDGYVVAILTNGSGSIPAGIPVVETISDLVARSMLLPAAAGVPSGVD